MFVLVLTAAAAADALLAATDLAGAHYFPPGGGGGSLGAEGPPPQRDRTEEPSGASESRQVTGSFDRHSLCCSWVSVSITGVDMLFSLCV